MCGKHFVPSLSPDLVILSNGKRERHVNVTSHLREKKWCWLEDEWFYAVTTKSHKSSKQRPEQLREEVEFTGNLKLSSSETGK